MDLLSSNQIKTNKNILKKTKPKTNINTLIIFAFARRFVCKTRINGVKLSGPKDLPVSTALPKRIRKVGVLCIPVLLFFRLFSFHLFLFLVCFVSLCSFFFCTFISTVCHLFMCVYSISSTKSLSLSVSISVFYYFCLYCLYVLLFIFLCHSLHFHRISVSISVLIFSSVSLFFVLKHRLRV